jgi:adenosylcobinamide amidohydrolase
VSPELAYRVEDGVNLPLLVWRFAVPVLAVSSASLGGGIGPRHWVLNATVPGGYVRNDPEAHLAGLAAALGLDGAGVGLMTAVDTARRVTADDGGVTVVATVGLGHPTWAAAPDGSGHDSAGTINVVAFVPARLADAALVNAVATVAEAKAQALGGLGVPATGTASDATCVLCPLDGPAEAYGGPRSTWGARLARAVHAAVRAGGAGWATGR